MQHGCKNLKMYRPNSFHPCIRCLSLMYLTVTSSLYYFLIKKYPIAYTCVLCYTGINIWLIPLFIPLFDQAYGFYLCCSILWLNTRRSLFDQIYSLYLYRSRPMAYACGIWLFYEASDLYLYLVRPVVYTSAGVGIWTIPLFDYVYVRVAYD